MKTYSVLLRMIYSLKIELVLVIAFTCIQVFYCINPYVINPVEFILYTKYLMVIGFIVWSYASFQLHNLILNSFPLKWLKLNEIIHNPTRIMVNQLFVVFISFLIFQLLIAGIIASTIIIIFESGFTLFKFIIKLYFIYFILPLVWSWFIGLMLSVIYTYYSFKKFILVFSVFFIWLIVIFYFDYSLTRFNLFIENYRPYIDPVFNLQFINENLFMKLLLIFVSILVFVLFIKFKNLIGGFILSSVIIIFAMIFLTSNIQDRYLIDKTLLFNNNKLYEQVKNNKNVKIGDNLSKDWEITSIRVDPSDKHPIKVELTLNKKKDIVYLYLNEQFEIEKVKSEGEKLNFKQDGNLVKIETHGVKSLSLYYKNTIGTSFYPLMKNVILLPHQSNWYPQTNNFQNYIIDSHGTLHTNSELKKCKQFELIIGKTKYQRKGNNFDCLSILTGPYKELEIQKTKFVVYQPFLTKKKNFINLLKELRLIRDEICNMFLNEIENMSLNPNYCKEDIHTITIIPKTIETDSLSIYDSSLSNGNYIFYVNLFLDVNYKPVTEHVIELATFLIPYKLLEDEKLSLLLSYYLIEKLNIEPMGYLDEVMKNVSTIELEEWDNFIQLTTDEKEEFLKQIALRSKD